MNPCNCTIVHNYLKMSSSFDDKARASASYHKTKKQDEKDKEFGGMFAVVLAYSSKSSVSADHAGSTGEVRLTAAGVDGTFRFGLGSRFPHREEGSYGRSALCALGFPPL